MQVNAHADVDVVAVERDDQVSVMLELTAPTSAADAVRLPASVQVVLDRSGSMEGERLQAAKQALVRLVDRLGHEDCFGLVVFDDEVRVVVPAGPLLDKPAVQGAIVNVVAGGTTNLASGLLRGIQEARRVAGRAGSTLLVLSDGHANGGETDPGRLGAVAAAARRQGVATSTIGIGLGYDEWLLAELARAGQGGHAFAERGDDAASAVAGEIDGLLSRTVLATSLIVRPDAPVQTMTLWNDLPAQAVDGGVMIELGDMWSAEERKLVLTFAVPATTSLGLARIAELELRYVALPGLVEETITIPLHINVVPGDEAAGRIPDPRVRTEVVYQQVQGDKRAASDALGAGDVAAATRMYELAEQKLDGLARACPTPPEIQEERRVVEELRARVAGGQLNWAAKVGHMDQAVKSRMRGRAEREM